MKETLAELFTQAQGPTVDYNGLTVHGAVFRPVKKPSRFIVRFIKYVERPVQALLIDIDTGKLFVEDSVSSKMILRLDTSPHVVEVRYEPSHQGSKVIIYNGWINENGGTDAWLMHSGMLVEETGNKMILRCSDGLGEPTFDDLIVEIEFVDD